MSFPFKGNSKGGSFLKDDGEPSLSSHPVGGVQDAESPAGKGGVPGTDAVSTSEIETMELEEPEAEPPASPDPVEQQQVADKLMDSLRRISNQEAKNQGGQGGASQGGERRPSRPAGIMRLQSSKNVRLNSTNTRDMVPEKIPSKGSVGSSPSAKGLAASADSGLLQNEEEHHAGDFTSLEDYLREVDDGSRLSDWLMPIKVGIWDWLPKYDWRRDLKGDITSGLSVGIMVIPQGMAHASIAGLPPVMGLYAALVPLYVYACLGSSRHLAVGSGAVVALLVNTGISLVPQPRNQGGAGCADDSAGEFGLYCRECRALCQEDPFRSFEFAFALDGDCTDHCLEEYRWRAGIMIAFISGLVQVVLGLVHFGYIVNFFSGPVLNGFTFAAGCIILLGQVRHLFGFDLDEYQEPCQPGGLFGGPDSFSCVEPRAYATVIKCMHALPSTNGPTIGLGLACCAILQGLRMAKQKYGSVKEKKLWMHAIKMCGDFAALLVVLFSTIIAYLTRDIKNPVAVVGDIPKGLPKVTNPFNVHPWFEIMYDMAISSVAIGLISFISSVAVAKKFATRDKYDLYANQELFALGSANMLGSFCSSFSVQGSLSRTVVNGQNARSQLASLISATVVLLGLLVLTPLLHYLPKTGLAAIIIIACRELLDYSPAVQLYKDGLTMELAVLSFAFLFTLFVGVSFGILAAIGVSVVLVVQRSAHPPCGEMGRLPGGTIYRRIALADNVITYEKLLIYEFEGPLFFVNRVYFKDKLDKSVSRAQQARGPIEYLILNMAAVTDVDSTGIKTLREVLADCAKAGIKVFFVDLSEMVKATFWRTGLTKECKVDSFYLSLTDAVEDAVAYTAMKEEEEAMSFQDVAKWLINSAGRGETSAGMNAARHGADHTHVFDRWHLEHEATQKRGGLAKRGNTFSKKIKAQISTNAIEEDGEGGGMSGSSRTLDAEFVPEETTMRPSHISRAKVRSLFSDQDLRVLTSIVSSGSGKNVFRSKKQMPPGGQLLVAARTGRKTSSDGAVGRKNSTEAMGSSET